MKDLGTAERRKKMADQQVLERQFTIGVVKPEPRLHKADDGKTTAFLECIFANGDEGSVAVFGANPDEIKRQLDGLKAVVGQELAFKVVDGGQYKNTQRWRIRDFPGKPKQQREGGKEGGGYNNRPDWAWLTPEERANERTSIEAQVAAKGGVDLAVAILTAQGPIKLQSQEALLTFVMDATEQIHLAIRKAAGTPAIPRTAGPPKERGPQETPAVHENGGATTSEEHDQLLEQAVELYGTKSKVLVAAKKKGSSARKTEEIDDTTLTALIAGYEE
jgi:hypothetical protein